MHLSLWLVGLSVLLAGCGDQSAAPAAAAPPPAVSVVELEPQDVTPSMQFVGRVVSIDKVDLRARVQGFLEQRLFTEGQSVKKGDLLYVIEQPPFQAQVAGAKAQVARAEATVAEANATLERVQEAVKSGAVSKQELDQATANAQRARPRCSPPRPSWRLPSSISATPRSMRRSAGKIGLTTYTFGNLVGPDSGVLATIVSQDPIYVTFPVSTRSSWRSASRPAAGSRPSSWCVAQLPDGKTLRASGQGRLPQQPGRPDHRHDHGARRSFPIPKAFWSMASSSR